MKLWHLHEFAKLVEIDEGPFLPIFWNAETLGTLI